MTTTGLANGILEPGTDANQAGYRTRVSAGPTGAASKTRPELVLCAGSVPEGFDLVHDLPSGDRPDLHRALFFYTTRLSVSTEIP